MIRLPYLRTCTHAGLFGLALLACLVIEVPAPAAVIESADTIADAGDAPARLAIGPAGSLHVTDPWMHRILTYDGTGQLTGTFVPTVTRTPLAIAALPGGSLAVSDADRGAVDLYDSARVYQRSLGAGEGEFLQVSDLAFDAAAGLLYVVDSQNHTVAAYDLTGSWVRTLGTEGSGPGQFRFPTAAAVRPGGSEVFVADTANSRIQVFDGSGAYLRQFGTRGSLPGQLGVIQGIAVDNSGKVCVADSFHNTVQVFDGTDGSFLAQFGTMGLEPGQGLLQPMGVALDSQQSTMYVASHNTQAIEVFDTSGVLPPTSIGDWILLNTR